MGTRIARRMGRSLHIPPDLDFGVALGGSFTSATGAEESELPDSQDMATSAPASQESGFVVPPENETTESRPERE